MEVTLLIPHGLVDSCSKAIHLGNYFKRHLIDDSFHFKGSALAYLFVFPRDQRQLRLLHTMTTASSGTPPSTTGAEDEPVVEVPPPGWGTDDRISFSKDTGKYLQTYDDGSEMEYNSRLKAWMPVVRTSLP
jgi:hypothetical protein